MTRITRSRLQTTAIFLAAAAAIWILGGVTVGRASETLQPGQTTTIRCEPAPTPQPEPVPVQRAYALDTWQWPALAAPEKWKSAITRTILGGQVTSVILKSSDPCKLVGKAQFRLEPFTTTKASAPQYALGTYWPFLKPLTTANCAGATYVRATVSQTTIFDDAVVTVVVKKTAAPAAPSVPLNVEFNQWQMLLGYCGSDAACQNAAIPKVLQAGALLKAHRITPYKTYPGNTAYSWTEYVSQFALPFTQLGFGAPPAALTTEQRASPSPYAYVIDEPKYDKMTEAITRLQGWATLSPTTARLITTPIRHKDLRSGTPTFGTIIPHDPELLRLTDIFVPVAENFCVETWKGSKDFYPCREEYTAAGKRLWFYVSNMSHGAESGNTTGAPDLVFDAKGGAAESFGFYLLALKYGAEALLYYNSIQGWASQDVWANPYVFGGDGDGLILMPDKAGRQALPTMVLSSLLEASQWADTIKVAGLQSKASALMTNPLVWERDMAKIEALHAEAMAVLQ